MTLLVWAFQTDRPVYFNTQDLQHFPNVLVKLRVNRKETNDGKPPSLNIKLEKRNSRRKASRAFVPRFPKVK